MQLVETSRQPPTGGNGPGRPGPPRLTWHPQFRGQSSVIPLSLCNPPGRCTRTTTLNPAMLLGIFVPKTGPHGPPASCALSQLNSSRPASSVEHNSGRDRLLGFHSSCLPPSHSSSSSSSSLLCCASYILRSLVAIITVFVLSLSLSPTRSKVLLSTHIVDPDSASFRSLLRLQS